MKKLIIIFLIFLGCGVYVKPKEELKKIYPNKKIWKSGWKHYIIQIDKNNFMYVNHGVFGLEYMPLVVISEPIIESK